MIYCIFVGNTDPQKCIPPCGVPLKLLFIHVINYLQKSSKSSLPCCFLSLKYRSKKNKPTKGYRNYSHINLAPLPRPQSKTAMKIFVLNDRHTSSGNFVCLALTDKVVCQAVSQARRGNLHYSTAVLRERMWPKINLNSSEQSETFLQKKLNFN